MKVDRIMITSLAVLFVLLQFSSNTFQSVSQFKLKNWEYEYRMLTLEANLKATQQVLSDFLSAFTNNTRTMKDIQKSLLKTTEGLIKRMIASYRNETSVMQARINRLYSDVANSKSRLSQTSSELRVLKKDFKDYGALKANSTWSLQRVDVNFPKLTHLALHLTTPTFTEKLPTPLPRNARALIISIYCNFWNTGGHAYLDLKINQKGNEDSGIVTVYNTHYMVYANNFYYEVLLPWDSGKPEEIIFKVTNSYQTGGPHNWYTVKLVGYITA